MVPWEMGTQIFRVLEIFCDKESNLVSVEEDKKALKVIFKKI